MEKERADIGASNIGVREGHVEKGGMRNAGARGGAKELMPHANVLHVMLTKLRMGECRTGMRRCNGADAPRKCSARASCKRHCVWGCVALDASLAQLVVVGGNCARQHRSVPSSIRGARRCVSGHRAHTRFVYARTLRCCTRPRCEAKGDHFTSGCTCLTWPLLRPRGV